MTPKQVQLFTMQNLVRCMEKEVERWNSLPQVGMEDGVVTHQVVEPVLNA